MLRIATQISYLAWSSDEMIPLWLQVFSGEWTSPLFALTDDSKAYSKAPAPPTVRPANVANYSNRNRHLIMLTSKEVEDSTTHSFLSTAPCLRWCWEFVELKVQLPVKNDRSQLLMRFCELRQFSDQVVMQPKISEYEIFNRFMSLSLNTVDMC